MAKSALGLHRAQWLLCVVTGLLVAGHVWLPWQSWRTIAYLTATTGGAVVAVFALRGSRHAHQWRWVAVSVALSAAAEGIYEIHTSAHGVAPDVSWADPLWLLSYVTLGIGATGILGLRGANAPYRDVDAVIDMVGAALVGGILVWTFALGPTIADDSTSVGIRLVWSTYPVLDVALLTAFSAGALANRRLPRQSTILCGGLMFWLLSDFGFLVAETNGFAVDAWLNAGWMIGAMALGLAVWTTDEQRPAHEPNRRLSSNRLRVVAGVAPLLVPAALEIWAYQRGEDVNPWPLGFATVALVGLAYARWIRLIHEQERAVSNLDASERYYRGLAANASDAVLVVAPDGTILRDSPTFAKLAALQSPVKGLNVTALPGFVAPDFARDLLRKACAAPGDLVRTELAVPDQGNGEQWFALRVMDALDDDSIGGIVINIHDITAQKVAEEELRRQALRDSLTGLSNRALFRDRVMHALDSRGLSGLSAAVLFVDLDEFKVVNDTLGHEAGDHLLVVAAQRLLGAVRTSDTVARLGGDEFAVLIESNNCEFDTGLVAQRILDDLRNPIELNDRPVVVSCSIGIAFADEGCDASSLLRHADMAMYDAKANGKGRWALYDPAMGEATRVRLDLEGDLRHALAGHQFELAYQPIVEISSGSLTGFEALLRWRHPGIGVIPPAQFIPILESKGLIIEVGAWVLEQACRTIVSWSEPHDGHRMTMSVNVSSVQLAHPEFVATVERILQDVQIDPALVVLEVTETVLVNDSEITTIALAALRALGVKVAIDDFGTGYSSLNYLQRLPCDSLKIDKSFIDAIQPGANVPPIVRGLLDLARTLGLEVVAEGIEDEHQLAQLRLEHCDKGQGYHIARPLTPADAQQFMRDYTPSGIAKARP